MLSSAYLARLINVGFGNMVAVERLTAIISADSAPIKRMIQEARESGNLIDATCGRRTRAVIVLDSKQIVLSAIQPETIAGRLNGKDLKFTNDEGEEA
jgi:Uncharacterized protein conserved in bacteria